MNMAEFARRVCMLKESGYYPPGAEFDKNAPYNQKEMPDLEQISDVLAMIGDLEEAMEVEDALNPWLKTVRLLYDEIANLKLQVEEGEY